MQTIAASETFQSEAGARATPISWVSRIVIFAATCIVVGILWDISWHRTIGRDTFWTPAHLAIYLGGALSGLTAGILVIRATFFATPEEKAGTVGIWGLRGPIGAWVCIWGAIAMLTSAPFDDWWHNAYGLDVKIISPPHSVLAFGMWAVVGGGLLLVVREQNNSDPNRPAPARWLFVYGVGVLLAMAAVFLLEYTFPNQHRSDRFYTWTAATFPFYLIGVARAAKTKWAATLIALGYMLIFAAMVWILPLFEGEPKLGPVLRRIDHFVPQPFPMLLIIPAIAIDLIRQRIGVGQGWMRDWMFILISSVVFLALFAVTQWNFSTFMLSSWSENWFFGGNRHWGFGEQPARWQNEYWHRGSGSSRLADARTFATALLGAIISGRLGLWVGNWMAKVHR